MPETSRDCFSSTSDRAFLREELTSLRALPGHVLVVAGLVASLFASPAFANNVGENGAWQFETAGEKANKAYIEDMRQKKKTGYYAAPVYNTYIDRQYNCSVVSTATGSQSSSTAVGNSPTTSGHTATSTGNTDTTSVGQGQGSGGSTVSGSQSNSGEVEATASGETEATVHGNTYQALNTTQTNSGTQNASVAGSNACQFGPLN